MDSGSVSPTAGLCVVTKLKYEHLYLSSFSKMRVDLAAQVLQHTASSSYIAIIILFILIGSLQVMSQTVSKALLQFVGSKAEGTAELLSIVDQMFDCLNVRNVKSAKMEIKPFRSPYRSGSDWRLKVGKT